MKDTFNRNYRMLRSRVYVKYDPLFINYIMISEYGHNILIYDYMFKACLSKSSINE